MPKPCRIAPTFPVADVDGTIRWYETHFGFTSYPFPEKPPYAFASVRHGDVEIMFQRTEGYQKPDLYHLRDTGVWDGYIRMEGVKELYEAVKDKVGIKLPLQKQGYGDWEFEVIDPNGYILVFSELTD
jgi:uncharacterized glyoxalase superfamily protein PhnB